MSFPIYLILFFILPSFSLGSYRYQLLRNATIKLNFNISDSYGHSMNVSNCTRCLCEAFKHPNRPPLFTCGETSLTSFFCQFYYFMPARDEIEYPVSHTNLYLMTNDSFTSKDDCCNTTFLIEQMKKATIKTNFYNQSLRTIIYADNNRFVAADYDGKKLVWFNQSTLEQVDEKHFGENIKSVAYVNKRYYAAADKNIYVFNETSSPSKRSSSVFLDGITVIYPLTNNQLLVGTTSKGAYICEENADETDFKSCNAVSGTGGGHQVHAFYAVNETAFYIGWIVPNGLIALFTNESGSWQPKSNNIRHDNKTSHIAIDDCQRIWALAEASHQISIYDRTGNLEGIMNIGTHPIFSFLILSNYTLVISHENNPGLSRVNSSLNCNPKRANKH